MFEGSDSTAIFGIWDHIIQANAVGLSGGLVFTYILPQVVQGLGRRSHVRPRKHTTRIPGAGYCRVPKRQAHRGP